MYKSPIEIIQEQMTMQMNMEMENGILKAVQRYNIDVDKEELLKALKYDREQYDKGYQDGLNADKWIPCSERLSEEDVDVLACIKDGYGNYYQTVTYHHIVWQTEVGGMYGEVIAWQPLPELYKGE